MNKPCVVCDTEFDSVLSGAVKNPCATMGCFPLCLLTPTGGQCMCPDFSTFQVDSEKICNTRKCSNCTEFPTVHSKALDTKHVLLTIKQ